MYNCMWGTQAYCTTILQNPTAHRSFLKSEQDFFGFLQMDIFSNSATKGACWSHHAENVFHTQFLVSVSNQFSAGLLEKCSERELFCAWRKGLHFSERSRGHSPRFQYHFPTAQTFKHTLCLLSFATLGCWFFIFGLNMLWGEGWGCNGETSLAVQIHQNTGWRTRTGTTQAGIPPSGRSLCVHWNICFYMYFFSL